MVNVGVAWGPGLGKLECGCGDAMMILVVNGRCWRLFNLNPLQNPWKSMGLPWRNHTHTRIITI